MSKVLIVADHLNGQLNSAVARCVSAAKAIAGASVDIVVLANDAAPIAAQAASIAGVDQVIAISDGAFSALIAQTVAPTVAALAAGYTHVFGPSTSFGKDVMPCIAALLDVEQVSDLMTVESASRFTRPIYAGNAIITVEAPVGRTVVATIRAASWPAAAAGGSARIEAATANVAASTHSEVLALQQGKSDRPDLQAASRVVSGGRAVGSAENFSVIYALADKLGAAVGASRAAVDAGYVPSDLQVGQTGKIISPELYIACGISGAIQHITGIKDAGTIVAINKDADAPIFEVADFGLVADLFQVVPELTNAL
ncbi:MAG: electron transfer flavoprotein subunit alpha/FixB family protein [Xanthomonadales bacterium]|nr:electron transfer flavoprotein subunit alpha/FixB family protein [Xanthomonadales bacterium]